MQTPDGSPGSDPTYRGPVSMSPPPPSNLQYLVAIVVMMLLGVGGIVGITILRPLGDNAPLITELLGFLTPTTLSLLAFMKAQETHLAVNSRLDEFMRNAAYAARAQGVTEGRAEGRAAADARTDLLAGGDYVASHPSPVPVAVVNVPIVKIEPR